MKRKKQSKKNILKSPKKQEQEKEKEIPKEIGVFNDFLIFDKVDNSKDNNLDIQNKNFDEPTLKEGLIISTNQNKKKSRFFNLFKEIVEKDKKILLKNKKNEEKSDVLPNKNEININKDEDIKNNNNTSNNNLDKDNNIIINNYDDNIINNDNNIINNDNNTITNNDNDNDNIINNDNNNIINDNSKDENFNSNSSNNKDDNNIIKEIENNINNLINDNNDFNNNIRNNSESLPNSNFFYSNPFYNNNYFNESSAPEISYSYTNQSGNFPLFSQNLYEPKQSIYSSSSGGGLYFSSTKDSDFFSFSNNNSIYEGRPSEKKFDINIDIKKVICLEDKRTAVMIKNIPNKFNREILLNIIDQNFKGTYDIFILPTDANGHKNFGYSFINFTCSYYIPYFYFLFHGKKWSNTNSQKMCEITYSKIQGRYNLLSHYSSKIIFHNEEARKIYNSEKKFIIPNEYKMIFKIAFPNQYIEENQYNFITKLPFKY